MNRKFVYFVCLLFSLLSTFSYSQEYNDKFGIGLNGGGQRIYGDLTKVGIGIGFEGFATYRILRFADLSLAVGYSQLKYDHPNLGPGNSTDLFNIDLRTNLELISRGVVRPYVSLGVGALNFHVGKTATGRFWDAAVIGGGGFRFRFSPKVAATIGADYRHTTGDDFDAVRGGTKDGYLSVRGGFVYYFPTAESEASQFIAETQAPIFEIDDDPFAAQELSSGQMSGKNMEQYARLKSRIDELNRLVESREEEIARLQSAVSDRKRQVSSLEKKASAQPPIPLAKASSMSGFSQVYEEALTHYYNEDYTSSLQLFRMLLQQNPNHSLVSNCHFWIGQNLFALNRFSEASAAYTEVLNHERSAKKDDALYQLGRTYIKMGNKATARRFFTRLLNECPTSEFAAEASAQVEKL